MKRGHGRTTAAVEMSIAVSIDSRFTATESKMNSYRNV